MLYTSPRSRFELTTSVVIGTDYIGSCKSNYHTITVTTTPECFDSQQVEHKPNMFEDTKGVIKSRKSKKDRQYNAIQKKKD